MTDREREARIREGEVLDREEFKTTLNDFCRECHGFSSPMPDYDVRGTLEAHDAAQRAEIERLEKIEGAARDLYRQVLGESVGASKANAAEARARLFALVHRAHRALNDGEDDG